MTKEEFKTTGFSIKTRVKYKGIIYGILSIDFEEGLILLGNCYWVRYENVELINE